VRRVPTSIKVEGGAPTIANGSGFAVPLSVTVLDQNGEPLAAEGNTIVATISRPDAALTGAVATTDSKGSATFTNLRVDGVAGPAVVTVTADFLASVEIPVEVAPGRAVKLGARNHPTQIIPLEEFETDPYVLLLDKDANQVERAGVTISSVLNGKVLGTATTDAKGIARFNQLKFTEKLTAAVEFEATVTYSVPDDGSIKSDSVTVDVVPGAPNDIIILTQPSPTARAGYLFETQPVVRVVDSNGNFVRAGGVVVTATMSCGVSICGFSGGTTATTDSSGVARFADLRPSGEIGSRTILFTAQFPDDTLTKIQRSDTVEVTAGAAVSIVVERSTSLFSYGVTVDSAFDLKAVDAWGNTATDFDGVLEVATSKSVDFSIPVPTKFDAGRLNLRSVNVKAAAGTYAASFLSGRLRSEAVEFIVVAGVAAKLEILVRPGIVSADATLTTPFAVQFVDGGGNAVQVANRVVMLTISAPNSGAKQSLTTSGGIATFSVPRFPKAGSTLLTYYETASSLVATDRISVVPGAAKSVKLLSGTNVEVRSGYPLASQPSLQLMDANGNIATQASVDVTASVYLSSVACPSRLTNNTVRSDAIGRVDFQALTITGKACTYGIQFCPSGGTCGGSVIVVVGAGDPVAIDIVTQPSGAVNRKPLTTQPSVRLVDTYGNAVSQAGVTVTATLDG
ncbi:MAG: hypothetical protein KGQ43_10515, partial [Acidobacteria bacterium]|nr:hypothetical protein [Acidobacteriota bacterium]